jgi:hypothetical protein
VAASASPPFGIDDKFRDLSSRLASRLEEASLRWLVLTCALLPLCGVCQAREPLARPEERIMSKMGRGGQAMPSRVAERQRVTRPRANLSKPRRPSRARPSMVPRASPGSRTDQGSTGRAITPLRSQQRPLEPPSATSTPMNPAMGCIRSAFGCDD